MDKKQTTFIKISSHRARQKLNSVGVPYITFWNLSHNCNASTTLAMMYESDKPSTVGIKGLTFPKNLPNVPLDWHSRNENAELHRIFEHSKPY